MTNTIDEVVDGLCFIEEAETHLEDAKGNWFQSLAREVYNHGIDVFERIEELYKERTGNTSMPAAYRSAKSVLWAANELDLSTTETGTSMDNPESFKGKSQLEKEIKEARQVKDEPSRVERIAKMLWEIDDLASILTDGELNLVRGLVRDTLRVIDTKIKNRND